MKFIQNVCPECGEQAEDILERIAAHAAISLDEQSGEYKYAGGSEVDWDSQRPDEVNGLMTLVCPNDHTWQTGWDPEFLAVAKALEEAEAQA